MLLLNRYFTTAAKLCIKKVYREGFKFINCCRKCLVSFEMNECLTNCGSRQWFFMIAVLLILVVYFNRTILKESHVGLNNICRNASISDPNLVGKRFGERRGRRNVSISYTRDINEYKYMLVNDTEVPMSTYMDTVISEQEKIKHLNTSYAWFASMRHLFKNLGEDEAPAYLESTPICKLDMSSLGPITVNKTVLEINLVEKVHSDVKLGGFHAPTHCRSNYRIAIFVPYRNRQENLAIFLYYIHRLLKKHLLEYRIFIIEQFGTYMFNRGKLFNIAYLESQRFGTWDCLIFHDVDIIPEDDRIIYNCSRSPFHIASAIEQYGYNLRYEEEFGGVTALTPAQYEAVNGYSNFYWSWGGEDDDMSARVLFLLLCKQRFKLEGLKTTNYKLIAVDKKNLFTHIIADVNPHKLKLDEKSLLRQMIFISGSEISGYRRTFLIHKVPKRTLPSKSHNNTTLNNPVV